MTTKVSGWNRRILRWARERSGLSVDEVASSLGIDADRVTGWEEGIDSPTYVQLEHLAYGILKRPLAVFFFPQPPEEKDTRTQFRLLPDFELEALEPDTLWIARRVRSMQETMRELTGGRNPAASVITREIDARRIRSLESLCDHVRQSLGVELGTQCSWQSLQDALRNWRDVIESKGVLVFKQSFNQVDISGFCLADDEFPVICINNSTSASRQVFTLFHELAHLLYAATGITKTDQSYVSALPPSDRAAEVRCNEFAGAFLVPSSDFKRLISGSECSDDEVVEWARHYNVSREVILRRLLDFGLVSQARYESSAKKWNEEFRARRQESSGGNYYATQAAYFGKTFLRLAFSKYYEGKSSLRELSAYLGMRAKNVEHLEAFLTSGAH
jgi:Zn-dependent peptidase ImmA (M78 family)